MKRKVMLLLCSLFFCLGMNVYAASNPYSSKGPYGVNCTWYTWKKVNEKTGISLPAWGNAKTWYTSAEKAGYSVGKTPKKNSVVVWNITSYGHVGYVERVNGNDIYVWDSDSSCIDESDKDYIACMEASVAEETDKACKKNAKLTSCKFDANEDVIGYIYLDSVPKTTTVKKTTVTTTTTSTTKVKSNNNYLSSLSIDIGTLNFDKNVFEYTLDVENDIDSIKIEALPEDNSSVVTGIGEFPLVVGINEFKISVTSESNETREYVIHINKKENEEIKIVKKKNDKRYILVVILVSVLLITILIFLLKFMINRKKVK